MVCHNNPLCFFFHNETAQGFTTLEEIVLSFESENPSFFKNTWIKGLNNLYWSHLEYTKEIALSLNWDYIIESKKHTKIKGSELVRLFEQKLVKSNSFIKLSFDEVWKKYNETILFDSQIYKNCEFYGISACRPDWKNSAARGIDVFCYSLLPIATIGLFSLQISFIFFLIECFFTIPSSFLMAWCMSLSGRTIGMKIVGLRVLTSQGEKLPFPQAFSRQSSINPFNNKFKTYRISKKLSPYGAVKWDRDNGCIITDQFPVEKKPEHQG